MMNSAPIKANSWLVSGAADVVAWLASLLPPERPRRVAKMYASGDRKYQDIPRDQAPPATWIADHLAGSATWAATLDQNGLARLGTADIERDIPEAGRAALLAAYRAIRAAGLHAFASSHVSLLAAYSPSSGIGEPYLSSTDHVSTSPSVRRACWQHGQLSVSFSHTSQRQSSTRYSPAGTTDPSMTTCTMDRTGS